jgi:iron complex outermembrane receptor protein
MKRLTNINPFSKAWRYALAALLLTSVSAFAQNADDDDDLEEVEGFTVVGSNIERLDLETVNPVINITREALDATGFSTAGDAIRALPIVSGQSLTTTDAGTSFTPGVSSVNLRGLGNNNTLALLNGRRVAPYATPGFNGFQTVVDLNSIPASAIESIQVLKDGASAIYGSDAVAGVINVTLTKEYDGLSTELSYGNTLDTDSTEWGLFAIGGATTGRASIVFTVDWKERNPLMAAEIDWTQTANGGPLGGFDQRSSANITANVRGLDATAYLIDPNGDATDPANQLFPSGRASLAGFPLANGFSALPAAGTVFGLDDFEDGNKFYNYQEVAGMFPSYRQHGFYTRMSYAVTETLDAFIEASFRRIETQIDAAPTPLFATSGVGNSPFGTIQFPATNPFNPFGVDIIDIRWRMIEAGNRTNDVQSDTPRIVAGLSGDLPLESWKFDTAVLFTESEISNTNPGTVFDSRLQEAFDGVVIDGELLYANPFGRNDPRIIDYVRGNNPVSDSFEVWSWDAKATGDVADLGDLGIVKAAVGLEYRYEEINSVRTNANRTGDIVGGSESTSVFGDRDIKSLYAEVSIPLTEMAEVQVAGRYEDYSDFGDTTKPKIALKVKPIEGLLLRGAFGQSFRAPDMPFLYSSGSVSFTAQFLEDPLRPDDEPNQIRTVGGGNPELQPEETDSYYIGGVVDLGKFVDALDGLSVQVDLWRFEQTDVISRLSATQIVANAGTPETGPDPFWSSFITRLPPGPGETYGVIQEVSTQWQNLDAQDTQGVDVAIQYILTTDEMGEFRFKVEGTYVDSFEFTNSFGDVAEFAGTWNQPKWRGNGTIAWKRGDWAASLFISYVGEYDGLYGDFIKSYWRFNPQVAYSGLWDTTLTFGIRNFFDEDPPVDIADTTTRATGVHNIEPRFFYLRVKKDW